jgi:hypothetical protein
LPEPWFLDEYEVIGYFFILLLTVAKSLKIDIDSCEGGENTEFYGSKNNEDSIWEKDTWYEKKKEEWDNDRKGIELDFLPFNDIVENTEERSGQDPYYETKVVKFPGKDSRILIEAITKNEIKQDNEILQWGYISSNPFINQNNLSSITYKLITDNPFWHRKIWNLQKLFPSEIRIIRKKILTNGKNKSKNRKEKKIVNRGYTLIIPDRNQLYHPFIQGDEIQIKWTIALNMNPISNYPSKDTDNTQNNMKKCQSNVELRNLLLNNLSQKDEISFKEYKRNKWKNGVL